MAANWTSDQKKVIDVNDQNILVAAAAGSGKTAVMVQRILRLISDEKNPVDVDELLVVTFTRAAADEMRERIRKALEAAYREDPSNGHLLRQLTLIHQSSITTIDSFCSSVVQNYFREADREPGFRVAEQGELKLLRMEILEEILEEAYRSGDQDFLEFTELYAAGKKDDRLEKHIEELYNFADSNPWPGKWLSEMKAAALRKPEKTDLWVRYLEGHIRGIIAGAQTQFKTALNIIQSPNGPYMYEDNIREDLREVRAMLQAEDIETLLLALGAYSGKMLSRKSDSDVSVEKRELAKNIRTKGKDMLKDLQGKFCADSFERMMESVEKTGKATAVLIDLTMKFAEAFDEIKRSRNLADFSDLEHDTLRIFLGTDCDNPSRTSVAKSYSEKYRYIFIDEYQDSNLVQEELLNAISREPGEHNLFMVGDVKQSIYSFRLARPEIFNQKYDRYKEGEEGSVAINLKKNFRSREEVLKSVNYLFKQVMQKDIGGVLYDEDAALYPGAEYPESETAGDHKTELLILDSTELGGSGNSDREKELEARMCAGKIRELLGKKIVKDEKTGQLRPAKYSDMVILLRSMSGWSDIFRRTLEAEGIPARTTLRDGYFSAFEVQSTLGYLRILNNFRQDIPLVSVLRNFYGFTEEEMACIRTSSMKSAFHEAVLELAEGGSFAAILGDVLDEKLKRFIREYNYFREKVSYTSIHEIIWEILDRTGFEAKVTAMQGGGVRAANLSMLIDKALSFEETSYTGLYHFIRYIDRMIRYEIDFGEAENAFGEQDSIEIQTIHKSKGLEYPIVFLSGLGKGFNKMDVRASVMKDLEIGIGMDEVDPTLRFRVPTIKKQAISGKKQEEMLGEELRVLYVGMTRAKEKLIMTGTVANLEKKLFYWMLENGNSETAFSYDTRYGADKYLDYIMPAVLRNKCRSAFRRYNTFDNMPRHPLYEENCQTDVFVMTPEDLVWEKVQEEGSRKQFTQWILENLGKLSYHRIPMEVSYKYEADMHVPMKVSVSDLKHEEIEKLADFTEVIEEQVPEMDTSASGKSETEPLGGKYSDPGKTVPAFLRAKAENKGARRGDAYHHFLQHFDYQTLAESEGTSKELYDAVNGEIKRVEEADLLPAEEREFLKAYDFVKFLESGLGKRMRAAAIRGELYREQPFVLGIPASEARDEYKKSTATVLIQGIIDGYFTEGDKIVLLDYKTDHLSTEQEFLDRYKLQLNLYRRALEQITGRQVKDVLIYSFRLHCEISVPEK